MTKISRISRGPYEGCLVGFAGTISLGLMMLQWIEAGADHKEFPEKQKDDCGHVVLITPKGEVYAFDENPVPVKFEDILFATGSGRDFALGAMATGSSARQAVLVATRFDCATGNGVDVLHLVEIKK